MDNQNMNMNNDPLAAVADAMQAAAEDVTREANAAREAGHWTPPAEAVRQSIWARVKAGFKAGYNRLTAAVTGTATAVATETKRAGRWVCGCILSFGNRLAGLAAVFMAGGALFCAIIAKAVRVATNETTFLWVVQESGKLAAQRRQRLAFATAAGAQAAATTTRNVLAVVGGLWVLFVFLVAGGILAPEAFALLLAGALGGLAGSFVLPVIVMSAAWLIEGFTRLVEHALAGSIWVITFCSAVITALQHPPVAAKSEAAAYVVDAVVLS